MDGTNQPTNKRTNKWTNKPTNEPMNNGWMNGWMMFWCRDCWPLISCVFAKSVQFSKNASKKEFCRYCPEKTGDFGNVSSCFWEEASWKAVWFQRLKSPDRQWSVSARMSSHHGQTQTEAPGADKRLFTPLSLTQPCCLSFSKALNSDAEPVHVFRKTNLLHLSLPYMQLLLCFQYFFFYICLSPCSVLY